MNSDAILTEVVKKTLPLINNRPRKCMDWKTPDEAFIEMVLCFI